MEMRCGDLGGGSGVVMALLRSGATLKLVTWLTATLIHRLEFSVRTSNKFLTSVFVPFAKD